MHTFSLSDSHRALVLRVSAEQGEVNRWHPWLADVSSMCVLATMGYEAYLRLDGRVLVAQGFEPGGEDDEPLHFSDLVEGAGALNMAARLRYPELGALVPPRPSESLDCESCRGTGIAFVAPSQPDHPIFCGECHSLGWVLRRTG